jgi:hypothetical protein
MTSGTFSRADRPYLIEQLHSKVLEVDFVKRDGTRRTMRCTLRTDMLPQQEKPVIDLTKSNRETKENLDVIAAYDVEAKGWRSFRLDSVESVTIREKV